MNNCGKTLHVFACTFQYYLHEKTLPIFLKHFIRYSGELDPVSILNVVNMLSGLQGGVRSLDFLKKNDARIPNRVAINTVMQT